MKLETKFEILVAALEEIARGVDADEAQDIAFKALNEIEEDEERTPG